MILDHLAANGVQIGAQGGLATGRRLELLDVLIPHPGRPVQAVRGVRRDARDRQHSDHPVREQGTTGKGVRSAAGPGGHQATIGIEVVEHGRGVRGDVRDASAGQSGRSRRTRDGTT